MGLQEFIRVAEERHLVLPDDSPWKEILLPDQVRWAIFVINNVSVTLIAPKPERVIAFLLLAKEHGLQNLLFLVMKKEELENNRSMFWCRRPEPSDRQYISLYQWLVDSRYDLTALTE